MIRQDDIDDLVEGGLIPHGSGPLPEDEIEPRPQEGECVLLATHVDRGFSLPPHPFFRGFLNFFGAQLHHFSPNTIVYLAAFVSMCKNFLGSRPHWGLLKHIFTCRSQSIKKANPSDERTHVIQMCAGLGIQMRGKITFPAMILPESVRGWQSAWFYYKDQPTPGQSTGLPPFSMARVEKPSALKVTPAEKEEVKVLVERVVQLVRHGVTGMDLLEVFLRRHIQPLQARDHLMWMYSGIDDTTQIHPEEVDEDTVEQWLTGITGNKDNPRGSRRIPPLNNSYEPDKALTEMYSMPNGEQEQYPQGEASGGESGEWHSDGGEDDESDDSDDGEEVDSPPRTERRSKQTHDQASIRGKATAQTGRTSKRPQMPSSVPTEKAPTQSKATPSKPQKALPKIKVVIPIASGAATSGTSAYMNEDEEMEDAVTSNSAPPNVIDLPDDDEDVPLTPMGRRNRKTSTGKAPQSSR